MITSQIIHIALKEIDIKIQKKYLRLIYYLIVDIRKLLRFELDCGRIAAKPRRVKNASQSMLQRFFLFQNQANGMGDLISVLQPHTNVK